MPSIKHTVLAVATVLASIVKADYVIDPSSVSLTLRTSWCQSETSTCPLICQQYNPSTTLVNTCDPKTLTYGCLCGNNQQPNVSEYSLTLPFFVCQEWGTQCVARCGSDNKCASSCQQDHPCGAQNPTKVNTTTASTMAATGTGTATGANVIYTGLDGSGATTSKPNGASPSLETGTFITLFAVTAGVVSGFGFLL